MKFSNDRQWFALGVGAYILLRAFSYFFYAGHYSSSYLAMAITAFFGYICYRDWRAGWTILLTEIFLGASGHFIELFGLIPRTYFLAIFFAVYFFQWTKGRVARPEIDRRIILSLKLFSIFLITATIIGFWRGHGAHLIIQDLLLYGFLIFLWPAHSDSGLMSRLRFIVRPFIAGSFIFSALTLFLFSSGLLTRDTLYYHWFRNVASGKITDLGLGIYRIVLPEHIFLLPIIFYLIAMIIASNRRHISAWVYLGMSLFVLGINLTRIYWIALIVGILVINLIYRSSRALIVSLTVLGAFVLIFSSTCALCSSFRSWGFDLLGLRSAQIAAPETDVSGAIRLAMLPDIQRQISDHPWLGNGLASTVSYIDPASGTRVTRTQFDWGYFEMMTELGIFGFISYVIILGAIFIFIAKSKTPTPISIAALATLIAFLVGNITTPVIFQGFGVVTIALLPALMKNSKINDAFVG